jgi:hypothetical protein
MLQRRIFFRAGAMIWIAGGIGHFFLVDVLTLHGRTRVSEFVPHADIFDTAERTTINFGFLGRTTAFGMTAGFSLWVALSLAFLGVAYLLLSREDDLTLRPFTGLGVVVSATFCALAARYFIYPAALGAALATTLSRRPGSGTSVEAASSAQPAGDGLARDNIGRGVTSYQHDHTQGPESAIAAGAATIYATTSRR